MLLADSICREGDPFEQKLPEATSMIVELFRK